MNYDELQTLLKTHTSTINTNIAALQTTVSSLSTAVDEIVAIQQANSTRIKQLTLECQRPTMVEVTDTVKSVQDQDSERIQLAVESIRALVEKLNRLRESGGNALEAERLAQKEAAAEAKREADEAQAEYEKLQEEVQEARLRWMRERDEALEMAKKVGGSL